MRVERTDNEAVVKRIVNDAQVLREMREVPIAAVPFGDSIYHMVASDDEPMGIASFFPVDESIWSPHMAVLPPFRGIGTELLRRSVQWMFANTPCLELRVAVPTWNTKMVCVFEKCGFAAEDYFESHVVMTLRMERN